LARGCVADEDEDEESDGDAEAGRRVRAKLMQPTVRARA
jgi:hypothetical protein